MVSLLKLAEITEEGVKFRSPYDDSECMLTPEHSIKIQVSNSKKVVSNLKKFFICVIFRNARDHSGFQKDYRILNQWRGQE